MNKRELIWLIVRLIGVYLAYCAFVTLFSVVSTVASLYSLGADTGAGRPESEVNRASPGFPVKAPDVDTRPVKADPAIEKLKSDAFKSLLFYIFLAALYGGTAFYLIRKGEILFAVLNRESIAARAKDPTVTTLRL